MLLASIVAFIWMFVMFAFVRWIAKKLRRPDPPVLVVAPAAYVISVVLGVLLGRDGWSRWLDPALWRGWAVLYAGPTVLVAIIDVLMERRWPMKPRRGERTGEG
jgi:hypothetical protein